MRDQFIKNVFGSVLTDLHGNWLKIIIKISFCDGAEYSAVCIQSNVIEWIDFTQRITNVELVVSLNACTF